VNLAGQNSFMTDNQETIQVISHDGAKEACEPHSCSQVGELDLLDGTSEKGNLTSKGLKEGTRTAPMFMFGSLMDELHSKIGWNLPSPKAFSFTFSS
jgi:hypothetical protein